MKSNVKGHYGNVVRIVSHDVGFDWKLPFQKPNPSSKSGSGFFIDDKGHILTCSHCVDDASHIHVEIPSEGNKQYKVKVKGMCPFFDIAVLQIQDYNNTTFCELDDGKTEIEQGFETFAIGYPLGQDNLKITKGIISGQQYNFYQTDTAINPGNSGGPLLYNNKVIGINAAGPAQDSEGIGYSVPINRFYNIKEMLFNSKVQIIHYPDLLGFEYQNTNEDLKQYFKSKCESGGILINNILDKSPVSQSELKKGDILCKINDITIDNYGGLNKKWMNESMSLINLISEIGINSNVKLEYWRGGKKRTTNFKLKPYVPKIRTWYPVYEEIDYECFGGLVLMNLNLNIIFSLDNLELGEYLKKQHLMKEKLVITSILMGSQIFQMDILVSGDIIKKVNDKCVKNLKDFRKQLLDTNGKCVKIETSTNKIVILSIEKMKKDDKNIRKQYNYTESKLFKQLK